MIVYCDTSFLVSYLNEDDLNHKSARSAAGKWDAQDFVICEVHLLELPAAVRAATHRSEDPISGHIARRVPASPLHHRSAPHNHCLLRRSTCDIRG